MPHLNVWYFSLQTRLKRRGQVGILPTTQHAHRLLYQASTGCIICPDARKDLNRLRGTSTFMHRSVFENQNYEDTNNQTKIHCRIENLQDSKGAKRLAINGTRRDLTGLNNYDVD